MGVFIKQHALKGQKLLAQGIALGIKAISKAPCKGKSFTNCPWSFKAFALTGRQVCEHDNPGRCPGLRASALSGRAACVHNSPGLRASAASGRAACVHNSPGLRASAPSGRAAYRNFRAFLGVLLCAFRACCLMNTPTKAVVLTPLTP